MAETPRLWTRIKRFIATFAVLLSILVCLGLGYYYLILDWEGRPFCHKQIHLGMRMWMSDNGETKTFPNIKGGSYESLITLSNEFARNAKWIHDYNYIPGLRENDPGDLFLMYFNRPTRWTWHGPPPSIFTDKAWIIVPVDFKMGMETRKGPGELSERVSLNEFKSRLKRTLDFVRTNERPNWQAVVAEHTKVLDALEQGIATQTRSASASNPNQHQATSHYLKWPARLLAFTLSTGFYAWTAWLACSYRKTSAAVHTFSIVLPYRIMAMLLAPCCLFASLHEWGGTNQTEVIFLVLALVCIPLGAWAWTLRVTLSADGLRLQHALTDKFITYTDIVDARLRGWSGEYVVRGRDGTKIVFPTTLQCAEHVYDRCRFKGKRKSFDEIVAEICPDR